MKKERRGESVFLSLLLVLFIGLKLTGHINWSWWWVLSPFWIPLCIAAAFLVAYLLLRSVR